MDAAAFLKTLLTRDTLRCRALESVAALDLPDGWIGAGFVRDAVWDWLNGYQQTELRGDVDVIWFDASAPCKRADRRIERALRADTPQLRWLVKHQARMHLRNRDDPYTSAADAMRHWPETATAVAVRLIGSGSIEINAPFGLDDLFALRLRPTPAFRMEKLAMFDDRRMKRRWMERYPMLIVTGQK